jgi:hypothetical protein
VISQVANYEDFVQIDLVGPKHIEGQISRFAITELHEVLFAAVSEWISIRSCL